MTIAASWQNTEGVNGHHGNELECGTLDAHVAAEELAETVPHREELLGGGGGIRKDATIVGKG